MSFMREEVITGYGKRLSYSDTDNGSYTNIFGTVEVDLPERELSAEEITNDDSPDNHKDYIPGMYEPGTAKFTYTYTKSQFVAIEVIFQLATVVTTKASATKYWKYLLPDGSIAKWRGFIMKHDLPVDIEGTLKVEGEMQVIGKVTFTAGVAA